MGQTLNTDALLSLISAVDAYQGDLQTNAQVLVQAGNVCSETMGNDAVVQKHLKKLGEALNQLQRASQTASEAAVALRKDYQRAMDVYNSIK